MVVDNYKKLERNTDYTNLDEFFSEDNRYFHEDNCIGFSDYSIVGSEYSESGFAPYAVAIHIVYFDNEESLRICHFVSDTNDDITDPANKFREALEMLVEWNKLEQLTTYGVVAFEDYLKRQAYPGLGTVKKFQLCII